MRDILGERDSAIPDQPTRVSEPSRESQLPKRFYEKAAVTEGDGGYTIILDGRSVRTPGRNLLAVGDRALAGEIAAEWQAQGERIDPMTMPLTRLLNTALDGVANEMQAVKEDIVRFAGTDMLCYRAGEPTGLVARQNELWDPVIDWAASALGMRLVLAEGVMHVDQPPESLAAFSTHVGLVDDPLSLAALHVVTALTGSAVMAMAVLKGELDAERAWQIAHVDEDWNISQWGEDAEAAARRAARFTDMQAACRVLAARP